MKRVGNYLEFIIFHFGIRECTMDKRLDDLLEKEVSLFIYTNNIKPTVENRNIVMTALCRGAMLAIGEVRIDISNNME